MMGARIRGWSHILPPRQGEVQLMMRLASPLALDYAELGEMLKWIPPGLDVAVPSAKMFEAAETV